MQKIIDFIETYQPGFTATTTPADPADIACLEDYTGPLPGVYKRFLQTMGAGMGELELEEAHFSIEGALMTYQINPWLYQGRCIYVASDSGLAGWDYFLDRTRPHGEDDCMLVRMPLRESFSPDEAHHESVSLEEFLYCESFRALRLGQRPQRHTITSPEDPTAAARYRPASIAARAEAEGFRRISPVEHNAIYERGDASLLLRRHPTNSLFSLSIGCEDSDELQRLLHTFKTAIAPAASR